MDLRARGQASGGDTSRLPVRRRPFEDLDAAEYALSAVRAQAQAGRQEVEERLAVVGVLGGELGGELWRAERIATGGEESGSASIGEEAVVADADEAFRKNVEQEAARELGQRERKGPSSSAAVVLEAEGDGLVVDVKEPVVGDRDAVGVAREVGQNVVGAVEGWLGVDDPLGATGVVEEALERDRSPVPWEASVQLERAVSEGFFELRHELAAEDAAKHAHREEEAGSARLPGASVVGQTACGNHAVHMGMMDERLAPGVKDREEAEACAEVAGVLGDLLKRAGCRAQQQVVDDTGVLESERRQHLRQGEDHVSVGHG
jgi:hypothetical protein